MENNEYVNESLEILITELCEKAISEKRTKNAEFAQLVKKTSSIIEEVKKMELSNEVREKFEKFKDLVYSTEMAQHECVYIQGIKDGVKLLKEIGVIS